MIAPRRQKKAGFGGFGNFGLWHPFGWKCDFFNLGSPNEKFCFWDAKILTPNARTRFWLKIRIFRNFTKKCHFQQGILWREIFSGSMIAPRRQKKAGLYIRGVIREELRLYWLNRPKMGKFKNRRFLKILCYLSRLVVQKPICTLEERDRAAVSQKWRIAAKCSDFRWKVQLARHFNASANATDTPKQAWWTAFSLLLLHCVKSETAQSRWKKSGIQTWKEKSDRKQPKKGSTP